MTPDILVKSLYEIAVSESIASYSTALGQSNLEEIDNEEWKSVHQLFHKLSDKERASILLLMKSISVDTLSVVLGVIDGSVVAGDYFEDFTLTYNEGENLVGDLQGKMLEIDDAQ